MSTKSIQTKGINDNYVTQTNMVPVNNSTGGYPFERGPYAVQNKQDLTRNMMGIPIDLVGNLQAPRYNQPMDLVGKYDNRVMSVASKFVTAAMINSTANFLSSVVAPPFLTAEYYFESKHREINMIEFTNIAHGGIPHEQTSREVKWRSTISKFALSFPILTDFAKDPNFGQDEWLFQLDGVAANAMNTINKQIAYALVHCSYENMVANHIKQIPFDLSKLYLEESESFCLAASDPQRVMRMIRRLEDRIPGASMVILPKGASAYFNELQGESQIMAMQKVSYDIESTKLVVDLDEIHGPKTLKTVEYANKVYNFVELPNFKVNEDDDRTEQPLRTAVSICQYYACNPDITADQMTPFNEEVNDLYLYLETKTSGQHVRVSYTEALKSSHYWNYKDGKLSNAARKFCDEKNSTFDRHPADGGVFLDEPNSNNNTADTSELSKKDLRSMKKFRHEFVGLVYNRETQRWELPERLGSFHARHLPDEWIEKDAEAIHAVLNESIGKLHADALMNEFYDLCDDIAHTVPSDEYLQGLADANAEFSRTSDNKLNTSETPLREAYPNVKQLKEWKPNRFGSLRLPNKGNTIIATYPWGFDSGPGLLTLSKEADNEISDWHDVGIRAKRVVTFLETLIRIIKSYVGNSDMINPKYTLPWFHVDLDLAVLVDNLRQYKAPVFLALPKVKKDDSFKMQEEVNVTTIMPKQKKFLSCLAKGNAIIKDVQDVLNITESILAKFRDAESRKLTDDEKKNAEAYIENFKKITMPKVLIYLEKLMDHVLALCIFDATETEPKKIALSTILVTEFTNLFLKYFNTIEVADIVQNKESTQTTLAFKAIEKFFAVFIDSFPKGNQTKEMTIALENLLKNQEYFNLYNNKNLKSEKTEKYLEYVQDLEKIGLERGLTYEEVKAKVDQAENTRRKSLRNAATVQKTDTGDEINQAIQKANDDYVNEIKSIDNRRKASGAQKHRSAYINDNDFIYLRAPLMASETAMQYILSLPDQVRPLILLADPGTLYEEEMDMYSTDQYREHFAFKSHNLLSPIYAQLSSIPGTFGLQSRTSPKSSGFQSGGSSTPRYQQQQQQQQGGYTEKSRPSGGEGGIFSSFRSKKSMDINDFLTGGGQGTALGRDYDIDQRDETRERRRDGVAPQMSEKMKESVYQRHYIGPWKQRLNYMRDNIHSPTTKAIFKAILLAPNECNSFTSPAKIGQKLMNVVLFRPFIQQVVSSIIVLEPGAGTCLTPISQTSLTVTKEERGVIHTRCDFNAGFMKINPRNIAMIPYVIPDRFIGGMKTDMMRNPADFTANNPEKPSILVGLTPVSEYIYDSPIHMLNLSTFNRPDTSSSPFRKWSGWEFFESVYDRDIVTSVEGFHNERVSYGKHVTASLCAHKGPYGIKDSMGHLVFTNGSGPRGEIDMNTGKAWKVHNGLSHKFPSVM